VILIDCRRIWPIINIRDLLQVFELFCTSDDDSFMSLSVSQNTEIEF